MNRNFSVPSQSQPLSSTHCSSCWLFILASSFLHPEPTLANLSPIGKTPFREVYTTISFFRYTIDLSLSFSESFLTFRSCVFSFLRTVELLSPRTISPWAWHFGSCLCSMSLTRIIRYISVYRVWAINGVFQLAWIQYSAVTFTSTFVKRPAPALARNSNNHYHLILHSLISQSQSLTLSFTLSNLKTPLQSI